MKISSKLATLMGRDKYPEAEVKTILDEFEENIKGLHPNSNRYRYLTNEALLRIGIAAGRFWERNKL